MARTTHHARLDEAMAHDRVLKSRELAGVIGATLRQVQIWTDADVLHCLPSTNRKGRGSQRYYSIKEVPIAAIIAEMSRLRMPIEVLSIASDGMRTAQNDQDRTILDSFPEAAKSLDQLDEAAAWFRRALEGSKPSYMIFNPPDMPSASSDAHSLMSWCGPDSLADAGKYRDGMLVINVQRVVSRAFDRL